MLSAFQPIWFWLLPPPLPVFTLPTHPTSQSAPCGLQQWHLLPGTPLTPDQSQPWPAGVLNGVKTHACVCHLFSVLWVNTSQWGCWVIQKLCLTFWGTTKSFFTAAVPFKMPMSRYRSQLLHIHHINIFHCLIKLSQWKWIIYYKCCLVVLNNLLLPFYSLSRVLLIFNL